MNLLRIKQLAGISSLFEAAGEYVIVYQKTIRGEIHDEGFWDFNKEDIVYKIAQAPKLPSEAAAKQKLKDIKRNMVLDKGIKLFIQSVADAEKQKANHDKMWDLVHGKKK